MWAWQQIHLPWGRMSVAFLSYEVRGEIRERDERDESCISIYLSIYLSVRANLKRVTGEVVIS